MWVYVINRLAFLPVLVLAVSLVTFTLVQVGPGDPVVAMLGNRYSEERANLIREEFGLNRPFYVQYVDYMQGFVRGDFGESFRYRGQPVRDIIVPKMWVSAQLSLIALAISLGVGLPVGFYIAHKQGMWQDPTAVFIALVLMSIPVFISGPAMLWALCLKLHWIPCSGWGGLWDLRIIVPAIVMGVPGIAGMMRLMRSNTLDVMGQDFIRTAHAKGLGTIRIDTRHVLRNSMIPIVTILAFSLAGLIGGAFVIELMMGIPGSGRFLLEAIGSRDYPVIMASTLIAALFFVLANLLADITYAFIDPRIRYQ